MDNLIFACSWDTNRSTSWSGTHFALFNALAKHYNIIDFDMNLVRGGDTLKIINKIIKYKLRIDLEPYYNFMAKHRYKNNTFPLLQFGDCPDLNSHKSYVFIDMAWKNVLDLCKSSPNIFQASNYARFSAGEAEKYFQKQSAFFNKDNCAAILCMGRWLAKDLSEEYKNVYHCGGGINVDPEKIDPSKKRGNKILFVGRDFERKNGPLVLEAFKLLQQRFPTCELYIAGPKNLNVSQKNVYVIGNASYEKVRELLNLCDVFCMPSIFEAYGLVFPEALAFGLPCIGRDAFEMPYFIEHGETGYLLKENSVEELAYLMEKALTDHQVRKNVLQRRDWYLKEYSWETVAERISKIIE